MSFSLLRRAAVGSLALALGVPATIPAQVPVDDQEEKVVRLGVTLVQVDAIATDRDGRPVADLTKNDIEILQDERPQSISFFSFVTPRPLPAAPSAVPGPPVPVRLPPSRVRRTIAIVVDDLASNESARAAREAVRAFVADQMEPGDQIAIVQARAGAGALQQFSANRDELSAAIDRIRYVPRSRPAKDCEEPAGAAPGGNGDLGLDETLRTEVFVRGTLGVLNFVVRGLSELPGRKSIVLLSDGMPCTLEESDAKGTGNFRVRRAVQSLVDVANRSAVAIYSIDVRGVEPLAPSAAEPVGRFRRLMDLGDQLTTPRSALFRSRDVLNELAEQTGGLFIYNTNDIEDGLRRALEDQRGYYLIGYVPDEATFASAAGRSAFHRITVRSRREGVTVRARSGFYGYSDADPEPETRTPAQRMVDAVISPFSASGVHMQVTPLFSDDPKSGPLVRCLLHVDARDLTFVEERDGTRSARVELAVVAFGDSGGVVSRQTGAQEIWLRADDYARALERGLSQIVTFPLNRAGAYSVRAAVRDVRSDRIGSAYQFVELPDIRSGELALSGIVLASDSAPVDQRTLGKRQSAAQDVPVGPASRRFKGGDRVSYGFEIYNARRDRTTRRPALSLRVRVYRGGTLIHSSESPALELGAQTDWARIRLGRGLQLGEALTPGAYVLELTVRDTVRGEKSRPATQWIDFEVEEPAPGGM